MAKGKKLDGETKMFKVLLFEKDVEFLREFYPNTSVSEIIRLLLDKFIHDQRRAYEAKVKTFLGE